MEGVLCVDELDFPGCSTSKLKGSLDCLRTAVAEERPLQVPGRYHGEVPRQRARHDRQRHLQDVGQRVDFVDSVDYLRVVMAQANRAVSGQEIYILVAGVVPDIVSFCSDELPIESEKTEKRGQARIAVGLMVLHYLDRRKLQSLIYADELFGLVHGLPS